MIVFYQDIKKLMSVSSSELTNINIRNSCSDLCSSNCVKPKNKCCNKYLKKGINCKRCPLIFELKAVS